MLKAVWQHSMLRQRHQPSRRGLASVNKQCHVHVQVLKDAGAEGLQIGKIVQELQRRGLRTFEDMTKAKNSIGSSCGHEVAFARVSPGVFALRCLPGVVEVGWCWQPHWDCILLSAWSAASCTFRGGCLRLIVVLGGRRSN